MRGHARPEGIDGMIHGAQPRRWRHRRKPVCGPDQPTTRTSRGKPVSRSTRPAAASSRTRSSIRTPGLALEVDARLHREDRRAGQRCGRGSLAEARRLMRRKADPMARAMPEVAPWPAASIMSRPIASSDRPSGSGTAVASGPVRDGLLEGIDDRRLGTRPPGRRSPGPARVARRRTASGSCRCDSPPTWAPKSNSRTAPSRTGRSPGAPCGSAACGPARQATSKASASAPLVRISHSSWRARVGLGDARS